MKLGRTRYALVSSAAALALLAGGCTQSEPPSRQASAPAVATGITVEAVGQVLDPSAFTAVIPISDGDPAATRLNVRYARGYNDHVAALTAGHVQSGQRPSLELVAANTDVVGLRVRVADPSGTELDTYTDWYSLTADAPIDPAEFISAETADDLARRAAVAAAAGASTVKGVLPVAPRPVTESLSFTPSGDLYWEFIQDGTHRSYSAPASEGLTEVGAAAAQAAVTPANPKLPRPVPDCGVEKCIALTFDDGPAAQTLAVLDTLAAHDSVGTFFVNGRNVPGREATLARIRDEGHQLGNHTQDHVTLSDLSPAAVASQIQATADLIAPYSTPGSPLLRPPYGRYNGAVLAEVARAGYTMVMWDVDPRDWATDDPQVVIDGVLAGARRGSIVLSHDVTDSTVAAYQTLIPELIRQGYTLVTVSELLGPTAAGSVHNRG